MAFLLTFPVVFGLLLLLVIRTDRRRQFVQQRLREFIPIAARDSASLGLSLRRRLQCSASVEVLQKACTRLNAAFETTGNRVRLLHLPLTGVIAAIIVVAFTSRILALNSTLATFFGVVAAVVMPLILLRVAQSRYQNRFLNVFPDALDLVRRAIRAGLPVNEALVVVGAEIADPVGHELRRALDQMQVGVQMVDALQEVADRVRIADFRFLVVALALQQKTGGSLAETLANLSGVIRARKALRLKARALSAEAKVSAMVLAALPFVVGGAMYVMNRDLTQSLIMDSRGRFMLGIAFLSLMTGLTTMYVMVKRAMR